MYVHYCIANYDYKIHLITNFNLMNACILFRGQFKSISLTCLCMYVYRSIVIIKVQVLVCINVYVCMCVCRLTSTYNHVTIGVQACCGENDMFIIFIVSCNSLKRGAIFSGK